jgi:hypothetical protein
MADAGTIGAEWLVHPVYLDVPMLVGFLAALENGYSPEGTVTDRRGASESRDRDAGLRVGLPSFLSLLGLDMSGRLGSASAEGESKEFVAVRRHTEASLFNVLRWRLVDAGAVVTVSAADDLDGLSIGSLVEITGDVQGNPLQQMIALMIQMLTMSGINVSEFVAGGAKPKPRPRAPGAQTGDAGGLPQEALDGMRTFIAMTIDVLTGPLRDVVLRAGDELRAVLTLAAEFIGPATEEYLRGGQCRVLAKVSQVVLSGDEPINLTRRTTMGLMKPADTQQMIDDLRAAMQESAKIEITDPLVEAPALQLLPLAIYI